MSLRSLGALVIVVAAIVLGAPAPGVAEATVPAPPDTVVADNEFIPDRDLDDCISALPQPGCGSEARSGWRQWLVFGVVVVGLVFIAWRIIRSARRSRPPGTVPR